MRLSQYQRRHAIYSRKRKAADKEARKEIESLYEFDMSKVDKYLKKYQDATDKQEDLKGRKAQYRSAREILNQLADGRVRNEGGFLEIYEKLVGRKGEPGFWYSDGLFRGKNNVADLYEAFIQLVRVVRAEIGNRRNPEAAFSIALERARQIRGLGINGITEILHTYAPDRYAVLNGNTTSALMKLGFENFGPLEKSHFKAEKYKGFIDLMLELARHCKFSDLSEVDLFLNHIYFKYVKKRNQSLP